MKDKYKLLNFWLIIIILIGIFFRIFNFEKGFLFAHDQDLYSWIAKDILVNHHQRLVGQVTSVDGVFIGSFYYYLMAIFYKLSNMNPLSAIVPLTLIGVFNIISIFWIFNRHFGKRTAYIGSFIYATSMGMAFFDRWSVPTQPTITWSIWFLATIFELYKGNLRFLPIYGFLAAFTWQVHIALLPILPIPILAYLINGNKFRTLWNKDNLKVVVVAIITFFICLSPFVLFELKYNFSQIRNMATGISKDAGGPTGLNKIAKVFDASGREFQQRLLIGVDTKKVIVFWLVILLISLYVVRINKVTLRQLSLMGMWYFLILLAQFTSKRIVSEYYFTNLIPVYLLLTSIFIAEVFKDRILILCGLILLICNGFWLLNMTDIDQSYYYRNQVVDDIRSDVKNNNYDCIAVNFIADRGVGVGFRYLFWYKGIQLVKPGTPGVPVYNIVIPWQVGASEEKIHFGRFGIIYPVIDKNIVSSENCAKNEYKLDPLLGYVE
jgi:hypothetical protein